MTVCPNLVLIVDNDEIFREGLQMVLADHYDRVLTTGNGPEAVDLVASLLPDVVLIDPEGKGLEAAQQIKARWPQTLVILFSVFDRHLNAALKIGADGYLLKGCLAEELLAAIQRLSSLTETARI